MKACWKDAGLTREGAKIADAVLDPMVDLVQRIEALGGKEGLMRIVFDEAIFQTFVLPTKSVSFQRRYLHAMHPTTRTKR